MFSSSLSYQHLSLSRERKGCPIVKAHSHAALLTDIRRLPWAPSLCLEKREEVPQAPSPTFSAPGTKKIDFQGEEAGEGVSGYRAVLAGSSGPMAARQCFLSLWGLSPWVLSSVSVGHKTFLPKLGPRISRSLRI